MSADKLVFDLSSEIESTTSVFVKKDWLNILDNMNANYSSNQSVIDTSQLSNSNKYLSYREAYLQIPLLISLSNPSTALGLATFSPATPATTADYSIGLKNWFGQIIHSFTLDYNGTTIIKQTPYINMWNSFRLMTSMSMADVDTQGSSIGFYPDDPLAFSFQPTLSTSGQGCCNNMISPLGLTASPTISLLLNQYKATAGNLGYLKRIQYINYDPDATAGSGAGAYSTLQTAASCAQLWKSHIFNKINGVNGTQAGILQIAVSATVYLKHIHSFFQMCPLLKGVFMKMTLNLNNSSVTFTNATGAPNTTMLLTSVTNPVGGVCPLMLSAAAYDDVAAAGGNIALSNLGVGTYIASVCVGATVLLSSQASITGMGKGPINQSIYLYVPSYTFNPVFEQAYLSSPIKKIEYTDVYQYQVVNISAGSPFNNLITNGISNVKSVLILPFFSATAGIANTGLPIAIPVYQSPFDPAGTGPTSPLCALTNFNVVVSGQNAIYNTQMRGYEQFNDQLYGANAVNGGLTDGLTSSLINSLGFELGYSYYYVNVGRMLPVEQSVPKSIQIIGTNLSAKALDLFVFVEYATSVSVDALSGSRI